jgi:hypothetical protein
MRKIDSWPLVGPGPVGPQRASPGPLDDGVDWFGHRNAASGDVANQVDRR